MSIPYLEPGGGDSPDIYKAVRDYIVAYALPNYDAVNIFRGWQNASHLPSKTNEYAVISIISHTNHGTPVEKYSADGAQVNEDGTTTLSQLVHVNVQVDCCSSDDNSARKRAQMLATVARSRVGTEFFGRYGIGCNYSSMPRDLTFIDGTESYVKRWEIELNLSYTVNITVKFPWFDNVDLNIENVDVHHKPE